MTADFKLRKSSLLFVLFAVFFFVTITSLIFLLRPKSTQAAWADDSYAYRLKISFTHNADISAERAITYSLDTAELITAGIMQSDCDDTRFTDVDGKLLKYQLTGTCNNAATTYEVVFPKIVNGTNIGYVYYSNSAVSSASQDVSATTALTPSGGDPSSTTPTTDDEAGAGPITSWRFDEAQGTTINDANRGANNSGVVSGATWQSSDMCASGNCLKFDGSNDYVLKVYASDTELDPGTGSMTVTAWFKHSSNLTGTDTLIGRFATGGYKIYTSSSGFCFGIDNDGTSFPSDSTCDTSNTYADSKWHFLSTVKNGTTSITLYIDGKQVGTPDTSITLSSISGSSPVFVVGDESAAAATTPWDGFIDEVKYFNFAKSAAQIVADFSSRRAPDGVSVVLGEADQKYLNQGLVGYWKMDESSWTANCSAASVTDSSGNNNNGISCPTTTGPTGGVAGKFGNAGSFDGSNDYVQVADSTSLDTIATQNQLTISVWVKPNQDYGAMASDWYYFAERDGTSAYPFQIGYSGWNDTVAFSIGYSGGGYANTLDTNNTYMTSGVWYHVVGTLDGNTVRLYKNGSLVASSAFSGTIDSGATTRIGGNAASRWFNGVFDEVRIYNRALSPAEVQTLYNWAPGPVGWWKMDENTGSSANDSSGNANTGTITAGTGGFASGKFGSGYNFDNLDTIINAASGTTLDNLSATGMSLSAWIYPKSQGEGSAGVILAKNVGTTPSAGWLFQFAGTNALTFTVDGSTDLVRTTNNSVITANAWNHVAVVWDGVITTASSVHIFVNGVEVTYATTTNGASRVDDGTSTFYIGNDSTQARTFDGIIDDAKAYNYARTPKQIVEDMNAGHPTGGSPIGTQYLYWKFDEQNGSGAGSVHDAGFGNTSGNLTGATWNLDTSTVNCKLNGCLSFGTSTNNVSGGDIGALDGIASMSATLWLNPTTLSTNKAILSKWNNTTQDNFLIATDGTTSSELKVWIASALTDTSSTPAPNFVTSGLGLTTGTWSHITVVYDSSLPNTSRVKVFKNGKPITGTVTGTFPGNTTSGTANLKVGASDDGTTFTALNSYIDEVKVYTSALTQSEMLVDMNAGSAAALGGVLGLGNTGTIHNNEGFGGNPPVSWWKMDENTGTSANDSGNNDYNGTLTGSQRWVSGKVGAGFEFDSSSNRFDLGTSMGNIIGDGSASFTISGWFYPRTYSGSFWGDSKMFSANALTNNSGCSGVPYGVIALQERSSSDVRLYFSLPYQNSGSTCAQATSLEISSVSTNTWYFFAATFDSSSKLMTGYLNGAYAASTTWGASGTITWSSNAFISRSGTNYFPGIVDDVKIYNYARTPAQIAYDYNRGAPVAWYKFDECQGSTANNAAPAASGGDSGMDGTITPGSLGNTAVGDCTTSGSTMWFNGATGKYNSSLDFDGQDDYITVTNASGIDLNEGLQNGLTISAWINADNAGEGTGGRIFTKTTDTWCRTDTLSGSNLDIECSLDLATADATLNVSSAITTTTWNHVVLTWTNDTDDEITVWVNGQSRGSSTTGNGNTNTDTANLIIGNDSISGTATFDGKIDQFQIFNYEMTPAQVQRLYNEGSAVRFGPAIGSP